MTNHDIDIHKHLAERKQIADVWGTGDVQSVRPDLTDDQAWEVLQKVERNHDANFGINWEVLECQADALYPEPEQTTFEVTVAVRTTETYRVEAANAQAARARWEDGERIRTVQTADGEVLAVTEV